MSGLAALRKIIEVFTSRQRWLGLYPSTVQGQAADGTLDLLPDDLDLRGAGGLQAVEIRHGLPGFTVEVNVGTQVLLGFEGGGDQRKPYAALWKPNNVKRIRFNGGELPIATLGALVTSGGPGLVVTLMPVLPAVPAPPNSAVVAGVPHFLSFSPIAPVDLVTGLDCEPLYGSVSDGVQEFLG